MPSEKLPKKHKEASSINLGKKNIPEQPQNLKTKERKLSHEQAKLLETVSRLYTIIGHYNIPEEYYLISEISLFSDKQVADYTKKLLVMQQNYHETFDDKNLLLSLNNLFHIKPIGAKFLEKILQQQSESWDQLRKRLLETFPSNETGLNIERMRLFFKARKLPFAECIFIYKEDYPKLKEFFGKEAYLLSKEEISGQYTTVLDLCICIRDHGKEKRFGFVSATESTAIHEIAHKSGYTPTTITGGFLKRYLDKEKEVAGTVFEEGFAGMMEGEYIAEVCSEISEFTSETGAVAPTLHSWVLIPISEFNDTKIRIPLKYIMINPNNKKDMLKTSPRIAAAALELLCIAEPRLRQVMIDSRTENMERRAAKQREMIKLINNLSDGLYAELRKFKNDYVDFAQAYLLIVNKVYGGNLQFNEQKEIIYKKHLN